MLTAGSVTRQALSPSNQDLLNPHPQLPHGPFLQPFPQGPPRSNSCLVPFTMHSDSEGRAYLGVLMSCSSESHVLRSHSYLPSADPEWFCVLFLFLLSVWGGERDKGICERVQAPLEARRNIRSPTARVTSTCYPMWKPGTEPGSSERIAVT